MRSGPPPGRARLIKLVMHICEALLRIRMCHYIDDFLVLNRPEEAHPALHRARDPLARRNPQVLHAEGCVLRILRCTIGYVSPTDLRLQLRRTGHSAAPGMRIYLLPLRLQHARAAMTAGLLQFDLDCQYQLGPE